MRGSPPPTERGAAVPSRAPAIVLVVRLLPLLALTVVAAALVLALERPPAAGFAASSSYPLAASSSHPLATAVVDGLIDAWEPGSPLALKRIRGAGATFVRVDLYWENVAPARPQGSAADPANPGYRWALIDRVVRGAVASGLTPIVTILGAPGWARPDPQWLRPDPDALGMFAHAAARRYSGAFRGLPHVRYWVVWNEPNLERFLTPQEENGEVTVTSWYRRMVNAVYDAVHSVRRDDFVVAGALAPNVQGAIPPLDFMWRILCVAPACSDRIRFDAWAVHPYTWGDPTHQPATPDGLSLGNLGKVRAMLRSAQQAGEIVAQSPVQLWVTEFGYDTKPPDPLAIPIKLQVRWTAQALYQMWRNGVSLVTWYLIRDLPSSTPFQTGLYFTGRTVAQDRPKPTLRAFRFPFVAFVGASGTSVWGRTPWGKPGIVLVQRLAVGTWRRVATLETDRYGIFQAVLAFRSSEGSMRARLVNGSDSSVPFGLKPVPDKHIDPFG
jgi:hypothetical protein